MELGYPDTTGQPLLGRRNVLNGLLLLAAPLPAIVASYWLFTHFAPGTIPPDPGWEGARGVDGIAAFLLHHPIVCVNVLFFANVCLGFWALSLIQRSTWLIDPYWTLIPPLIVLFYATHPLSVESSGRTLLGWVVMLVWSGRLTHNYLRREQWRFGFREDWRFAKRRAESRHFWWEQLFYVYVAQQAMLVGLTLPYWAIHFREREFGLVDAGLGALALVGIGIAHVADTQLHAFMERNAERVARGDAKVPLIDHGIWRWARHPNYFGEQLFWWSVAGWGLVLGAPWVAAGTALNSIVLAAVTVMTERRMLADPARAELYAAYRERTSVWLPLPPRAARRGSD